MKNIRYYLLTYLLTRAKPRGITLKIILERTIAFLLKILKNDVLSNDTL